MGKARIWKLIENAFLDRVCLTENGHYATPVIHYDKSIEKGHPFAYHVYGTAILVVKLDCIRGRYEFETVRIVHDFGRSMNEFVDLGQIEGGLVQGIGKVYGLYGVWALACSSSSETTRAGLIVVTGT